MSITVRMLCRKGEVVVVWSEYRYGVLKDLDLRLAHHYKLTILSLPSPLRLTYSPDDFLST